MEYIDGKTLVIGPNGPLRNPNRGQQQKVQDDFAIYGSERKHKPTDPPWDSGVYFMDNFDMAVAVAKGYCEAHPGRVVHLVQTVTVFQSTVKPPETLHFKHAA